MFSRCNLKVLQLCAWKQNTAPDLHLADLVLVPFCITSCSLGADLQTCCTTANTEVCATDPLCICISASAFLKVQNIGRGIFKSRVQTDLLMFATCSLLLTVLIFHAGKKKKKRKENSEVTWNLQFKRVTQDQQQQKRLPALPFLMSGCSQHTAASVAWISQPAQFKVRWTTGRLEGRSRWLWTLSWK